MAAAKGSSSMTAAAVFMIVVVLRKDGSCCCGLWWGGGWVGEAVSKVMSEWLLGRSGRCLVGRSSVGKAASKCVNNPASSSPQAGKLLLRCISSSEDERVRLRWMVG